jgi:ATP-dependent RNA helicase HelY
VREPGRASAPGEPDSGRDHPVTADPDLDARLRAATAADRVAKEVARLIRRVQSHNESLARQFDRVLAVLEAWGYVTDWHLGPPGNLLADLYTETDLLLAESLRDGLLDGLTPPELAALASCFTYERRGGEGPAPAPPLRWPTARVAERARAVERRWRALNLLEDDIGVPATRPPDPGFTPVAYEWARGDPLEAVLDDDLTGGDFVRQIKQCIDLLRQIGDVALDAATAARARDVAATCLRGVVAAASTAGA